ncbi:hypothetical protein OAV71_05595, partial [Opitutales bacterium]|nr:hypothetical protein [Opitutales bacterium]
MESGQGGWRQGKIRNSHINLVIARSEQSERRGNPMGVMEALGECCSLAGTQWIATGFALAMTRWWSDTRYKPVTTRFCHCEERAERETRQSIVSWKTRTSCLFAYWFTVDRHGLRPRDDKIGKEWECAVRFQHDPCHCEE